MELLNGLLCALPGTPVIYYGDEIGMGDNVFLGDRNGVRTPMQWSSDRNGGFSRANPQRLILPVIIDPEYHYESVNVEAQQNNNASLLWWMKRLIALRKRYQAFGRGSLEILSPANHRVFAFVRRWNDEEVLVVANLSRFAQYVELDLSQWKGLRPRELFGNTSFPPIGDLPYLLTIGGHGFYWLALERTEQARDHLRVLTYEPPVIACTRTTDLLGGEERELLEQALPAFLSTRPWLMARARTVTGATLRESVALGETTVLFVEVAYDQGVPEMYVLPVAEVRDGRPVRPESIIAHLRTEAGESHLVEALEEPHAASALLAGILKGGTAFGQSGAVRAAALEAAGTEPRPDAEPRSIGHVHASAAIQFGDEFVLKMFRRLEEGVSPELEMTALLAKRAPGLAPAPAGVIEYRRGRGEPHTLAVLLRHVPNEGTAWTQAREELRRYFERVLTEARQTTPPALPTAPLTTLAGKTIPVELEGLFGAYVHAVRLLGQRTADLHRALAGAVDDPAFAPEPYTPLDVRSKYQSFRNLVGKTNRLLRLRLDQMEPVDAAHTRRLLDEEGRLLRSVEGFLKQRIGADRIRVHGDLHLGQILGTGKDYVFIDFDGGRGRSLAERRRKRTCLRDVADLIRSFHAGTYTVLLDDSVVRTEDRTTLMPWADHWMTWMSAAYLEAYLEAIGPAAFLPQEPARTLLLQNLIVEGSYNDLLRELERGVGGTIPLYALVHALRLWV
jgi:maltose alpha-D-glucosyltransferase/alpha-amylase